MILNGLWVALSTYSTLPVPQFAWNERTTRYALCFFPVVGLCCGLPLAAWYKLCTVWQVGGLWFAAVATALPLWVTGGIHMDGYLDTVDALSSHQPSARKLEIMKDPHCGAFAVVYGGLYLVLMLGVLGELYARGLVWAACPGYVLSRALSGLCAANLPNARKTGMLAAMTHDLHKKRANAVLALTAVGACGAMIALAPLPGLAGAAAALIWVWGYRRMTARQFGGVTGDTAGFFLQICELVVPVGIWLGGMLR